MTKFRGTMEVNFSVDAKDPEDARLQVKNIIRRMTAEDVLRNVAIQNIDPQSPDLSHFYFVDKEEDEE